MKRSPVAEDPSGGFRQPDPPHSPEPGPVTAGESPRQTGDSRPGLRESLLILTLLAGTWTVLTEEILGALRSLDRSHLALSWCIFVLGAAVVAWRLPGYRRWLAGRLRQAGRPSAWLTPVAVIALVTLAIALIAPPNNGDALEYHMPRVAHWAQDRSLAHYPTPIDRQLYMPPFAEMAVLNVYVLAGSDRFVNLIQWASLMLALSTVSLICSRLGGRRGPQAFAVLFAATLPMAILQASGAQNDLVAALWLLSLAHYARKSHQVPLTRPEWALAGIAAGLGTLTKVTFPAFAFPLLVWLGVSTLRRAGWRSAFRFALVGLAVVVALNAAAWVRNARSYGTPLGPRTAIAAHGNQLWSWRVVVSNIVRGATLSLATPYGDVNGLLRDGVVTIHNWLGLAVDDPRTTWGEYRVKRAVNDEFAGYPFHYLLILACGLVLLWRPKAVRVDGRGPMAAYAAALLAGYFLFCALFKWQLGANRLLLPLYVAAAPLAGLALDRSQSHLDHARFRRVAAWAIGLVLVLGAVQPLLANPSRPLLPRPEDGLDLRNTSRQGLLFITVPELASAYEPLIEVAHESGCDSIGLKIDSAEPEYIFWALLAPPRSGVRLEHIDVGTAGAPSDELCGIVCTYCTETRLYGLDLLFNHLGRYSYYTTR